MRARSSAHDHGLRNSLCLFQAHLEVKRGVRNRSTHSRIPTKDAAWVPRKSKVEESLADTAESSVSEMTPQSESVCPSPTQFYRSASLPIRTDEAKVSLDFLPPTLLGSPDRDVATMDKSELWRYHVMSLKKQKRRSTMTSRTSSMGMFDFPPVPEKNTRIPKAAPTRDTPKVPSQTLNEKLKVDEAKSSAWVDNVCALKVSMHTRPGFAVSKPERLNMASMMRDSMKVLEEENQIDPQNGSKAFTASFVSYYTEISIDDDDDDESFASFDEESVVDEEDNHDYVTTISSIQAILTDERVAEEKKLSSSDISDLLSLPQASASSILRYLKVTQSASEPIHWDLVAALVEKARLEMALEEHSVDQNSVDSKSSSVNPKVGAQPAENSDVSVDESGGYSLNFRRLSASSVSFSAVEDELSYFEESITSGEL